MPLIRLILLLVVLGSLTLLLVQNWSPVLPLVFLGMSTQALPLAVWILLSVAAGAFTSLLITGFFKMSNYFARSPRKRGKVETPPPRFSVQSPHLVLVLKVAKPNTPPLEPHPQHLTQTPTMILMNGEVVLQLAMTGILRKKLTKHQMLVLTIPPETIQTTKWTENRRVALVLAQFTPTVTEILAIQV